MAQFSPPLWSATARRPQEAFKDICRIGKVHCLPGFCLPGFCADVTRWRLSRTSERNPDRRTDRLCWTLCRWGAAL